MEYIIAQHARIPFINRPAKGGSLNRAGKNEGFIARRPPPFGRREVQRISAPARVAPFQRALAQGSVKNLWKLASRTFKISPNLVIKAAPNSKSRFFGRGGPRKTQFHGGFLADDVEVRRAERGIKPNGKMNRIPFGFIANFLLFAEGKTSKFPLKKSDNFPCEARLYPKAITN